MALQSKSDFVAEVERLRAQLDTKQRCPRCGRSDLLLRDIPVHAATCSSHTDEEAAIAHERDVAKEQALYWQKRTREMEEGWQRAAKERDDFENRLIDLAALPEDEHD